MNGVYFVFGLSVILTILAACFEIIRRDVVSDYIGFFFGFLVIGLVILWVYRQIVEIYTKRSQSP
jgi:tetrahydromethanopterin S-methyltransferase subunit G